MSDEAINDEIDADAEVIDDDEGAEVEGHVMFAAKKGFSLKPDFYAPPARPGLDGGEAMSGGSQSNEPVLGDDALDEDEEAEVEGHDFNKNKFSVVGPVTIPSLEVHNAEGRNDAMSQNTNEPVLDDGF